MSPDSSFHPGNKPPRQYLIDDPILEKPGRLRVQDIDISKQRLAGRLTEIGEKIIEIGS